MEINPDSNCTKCGERFYGASGMSSVCGDGEPHQWESELTQLRADPLEVNLSDILKTLLGTACVTTGAVPRMRGGFASIELTGVVTKANIIRVFEKFGVKQPPLDGKED